MTSSLLVLDNFDSFTYNLVHLVEEVSGVRPHVRRNNAISIAEASQFSKILLSPGPGVPSEAGIMPPLVAALASSTCFLGVCLGHQCVAEHFGATLENLAEVSHGQSVATEVVSEHDPLFEGVPKEFQSGRYHSWVVSREALPRCLEVTAQDRAGRIMALRHKDLPIW